MNENNSKDTKILKTLAYKLSELRKAKGKTLEEASKNLGISISSLGSYETSIRKPDPDKLFLLADYYNVSIDYLLGRTPDVFVGEKDKIDFDISLIIDIYNKAKKNFSNPKEIYENENAIMITVNELMCGVGTSIIGNVKLNKNISFEYIDSLLKDFESVEMPSPQVMIEIRNKSNDILIVEADCFDDKEMPLGAVDRLYAYTGKLATKYNVFGLAISIDKNENCKMLSTIYQAKGESKYLPLNDLPKTVLTASEYIDVMSRL